MVYVWVKYMLLVYGYEGFIENCHNRSILSVLSNKRNIGVERTLYDSDARTMWSSKKLLCYHHSMDGNKEF